MRISTRRGRSPCWARAAIGRTAAVATLAMNSRRFMPLPAAFGNAFTPLRLGQLPGRRKPGSSLFSSAAGRAALHPLQLSANLAVADGSERGAAVAQKGFLLIADITGYTMFLTGSELEHAQGV